MQTVFASPSRYSELAKSEFSLVRLHRPPHGGGHVMTFNREDADERADACYRKMSEAVGKRGVFVGRAPVDYHDFHMAQAMPAYRNAGAGITQALDPMNVIAPGRYGIG